MNEAAFYFSTRRFDFFSGKKTIQSVLQKRMAGVWVFRSLAEAIIDCASIKYCPGFCIDAKSFRRSSRVERPSQILVVVQEHGKIDGKVPDLFFDGFRVVVGVGIDKPKHDSFGSKLIPERLDCGRAFLDDRTTGNSKNQHDSSRFGLAIEFMRFSLMIRSEEHTSELQSRV